MDLMSLETARILNIEAYRRWGETPDIKRAVFWINRKPEAFYQRVAEFETNLFNVRALMRSAGLDFNYYRNIIKFREVIGDAALHTAEEWIEMYQEEQAYGEHGFATRVFDRAFAKVNRKIAIGEWQFAREVKNPYKLASGLLIEGYGLFAEEFYAEPGLARDVVLALEESLIVHLPQSHLLGDVIGWMMEEKDDFPPGIAQILS